MRTITALAGAAVLITAGLTASPAMADPSGGPLLEVDCGDAGSFTLTTNAGRGNYTPAFDTASNRVFVPVSFGETTFAVYDENDNLLEGGADPATTRLGNRTGQGAMECAFSTEFTDDVPEIGPIRVVFSGTVVIKTKSA